MCYAGRMNQPPETYFSLPVDEAELTLRPEIVLTRELLATLMRFWRQPGLTLDDARRLAMLVFSGARTVAILVTHQLRLNGQAPDNEWLKEVLDELGKEIGEA